MGLAAFNRARKEAAEKVIKSLPFNSPPDELVVEQPVIERVKKKKEEDKQS